MTSIPVRTVDYAYLPKLKNSFAASAQNTMEEKFVINVSPLHCEYKNRE